MASDFGVDDGEVVRAVLDGHRDLYRILVRRYQDPLYRHAVRMVGHPDDAADMVQRALVRGFHSLDSCRDPDRVGGWLFRICANLCKDHLKSPRRNDLSLDGIEAAVPDPGTPDDALERSRLRDALDRALGALPSDQREAFVLKHVEGRTYGEMAEMLEASTSALKMRVHRARESLQELLGPAPRPEEG